MRRIFHITYLIVCGVCSAYSFTFSKDILRDIRLPTLSGRRRASPLHLSTTDTSIIDRSTTTLPSTDKVLSHPGTFSGQVEQALINKFDESKIKRVIQSWRLLEMDYEHREFVGSQQSPPLNEDVDQTSRYYQHAPSYVPGLKACAWWDEELDWMKSLSKSYRAIRKEFMSVMSNPDKLQSEGNNIWAGALTEDASSYGEGWKTLVLLNRGQWDDTNANLFPKTAKAIHKSKAPVAEAFFASMKPHTSIKPHSDFTNFVLTSHVPIVIPENGNNKCRLSVGDETRQWIEGKVILFDTSIYHDAINESDEMRYILMLRVWHPDLSNDEREALQFIYDCLEIPELLSSDPDIALKAERHAKMMREFPLKDTGGFGGGSKQGNKGKKKKKNKKK